MRVTARGFVIAFLTLAVALAAAGVPIIDATAVATLTFGLIAISLATARDTRAHTRSSLRIADTTEDLERYHPRRLS